MNIIFEINGGLGKSIMATAVVKAIKNNFPQSHLVVVSHYKDVFLANPHVNKVISHDQKAGIYKTYIENQDAKVFIAEPYMHSDYITESNHLLDIWCGLYGIKYSGEKPEIFLTKSEIDYYAPFYRTPKPIMAIQPNGGGQGQPLKYSWTRDIPEVIMNQVIDYFKDEYTIIHIKREDQIQYPNTLAALDNWRSIAIMLSMSTKRLLIDSSAMHVCTALGLPSTVTWIGTNPKVFGYGLHDNIVANEPNVILATEHSNYNKHMLFEDLTTFPYQDFNHVFNTEEIIASLSK